jgi:hypothetical protein
MRHIDERPTPAKVLDNNASTTTTAPAGWHPSPQLTRLVASLLLDTVRRCDEQGDRPPAAAED